MFYHVLALSCGAAVGATVRWWLGLVLNKLWPLMPLGTLVANLTGGLLVGILLPVLLQETVSPLWRLFLITGVLGGLTTFSSFSAEVMLMFNDGHALKASLTILCHLAGSLLLTGLGLWLGQFIVQR